MKVARQPSVHSHDFAGNSALYYLHHEGAQFIAERAFMIQDFRSRMHDNSLTTIIIEMANINGFNLKGTVQRKLRWVEIDINRQVML
jgi:hypothetical protein